MSITNLKGSKKLILTERDTVINLTGYKCNCKLARGHGSSKSFFFGGGGGEEEYPPEINPASCSKA